MSLLVLAAAAVQASGAPTIAITDFAGEIRIEQGAALSARVERADPDGPVSIEETGAGLVIDGGRDMRSWRCSGGWRETRVGPRRGEARPFDELPLLIITAPEPAAFDLDDSIVRAEAGDLAALELGLAHCGAFQAGMIGGDARLGLSGSADVSLGDVGGDAAVAISGSSDVTLGDVTGALAVSISGSGDVQTGNAASLEARTSGSGGIDAGDIAGPLTYSASGSGDLAARSALGLDFSSSGSADLELGRLEGPLSVTLSGSGDAIIGDGRADPFQVRATGSGGVEFGGTAANVDVRLSGGGDVRVGAVEGAQNVRTTGGGDFEIGG
jgi:hypothetical protein